MNTKQLTDGHVRCFIVKDDNLVGICGTCNACDADVAKYLCNQTLVEKRSEAVMFDMWAACTNPACVNHEGRGYYMGAPDFFTPVCTEQQIASKNGKKIP